MTATGRSFDAVGIVRTFAEALSSDGDEPTFFLCVGHLTIPCHIGPKLNFTPVNGDRVRVVGEWVLDHTCLVCVEVLAVHAEATAAAAMHGC